MCDISVKYSGINFCFVTEMCDIMLNVSMLNVHFFKYKVLSLIVLKNFSVKVFVLNCLFSIIFHCNMI